MTRTRTLVVGGFSRSGHDSLMTALLDEFKLVQGTDPVGIRWSTAVPGIEGHPVFSLHRTGFDNATLSAFMDSIEIPQLMARDLEPSVSFLNEGDLVVSVHPWTTFILGEVLENRRLTRVSLVDVAADYSPIPVIRHDRVDLYLGGAVPVPATRELTRRIRPTGVPVRSSFLAEPAVVPGRLYVAAGRTGYAQTSARTGLTLLSQILKPQEIIVALAGSSSRLDELEATLPATRFTYLPDTPDNSSAQLSAEWILTKGSGASVSEALATGATVFTYDTGVFWEDQAAQLLHAEGATVMVRALELNHDLRPWNRAEWADRARTATTRTVAAALSLLGPTRMSPLALAGPGAPAGPELFYPEANVDRLPLLSAWMKTELSAWFR